MNDVDQLESERKALLRWISERNRHVPLSELAFMLGLPEGGEDEGCDPDPFSSY